MRWLIWLFVLSLLAVGLTLIARLNAGHVMVQLPGNRIDLSLNFAVLLFVLGFGLMYLLLRFLATAIQLPRRVAEMRAARHRETGRDALGASLREFFAGRYAMAEKNAVRASALEEWRDVALLVAARSAHELRALARRDEHLAAIQQDAKRPDAAAIVSVAQILLDERRPEEALATLSALPEQHTAALRLELRARQRLGHWEHTLPLIDQLEKRAVFGSEQANAERRHAWRQMLERASGDTAILDTAWKRVPGELRRESGIAMAAASAYHAQGRHSDAQAIIEASLESEWDAALVNLYGECRGSDSLRQIEHAERWLASHREDSVLLLALGRLCAQQQLWGKAQSYLEASLSLDPSYSAHLELAQLHDRLDRTDEARTHYRASLDLAVALLKQASGGRRRSSV